VAVSANVVGTFSEAMDSRTITGKTVTLKNAAGTTVSANVKYDLTGKTVTLDPNSNLAAGTTYTARIKGGSTGVRDAAGNPMAADKVWTFTT
jgi:hypothetical protein